MKSIYEVFDEFEMVSSKKDRMSVIEKNLSTTLVQVLELAFHPNHQWLITEMPDGYEVPTDVLPGLSGTQLSVELRKLYLFQINVFCCCVGFEVGCSSRVVVNDPQNRVRYFLRSRSSRTFDENAEIDFK